MDMDLFRKALASKTKKTEQLAEIKRRPEPELPKLKATMHKDTGYTTDAGARFRRAETDIEVLVQKEKPTKWIVHFPDGTIGVSSSNGRFTFHS